MVSHESESAEADEWFMAEPTGLEPATSTVTVWRSSQLSYGSIQVILKHVRNPLSP